MPLVSHRTRATRPYRTFVSRLVVLPLVASTLTSGVIPPDQSGIHTVLPDLPANPSVRVEHFLLESLAHGEPHDIVVEQGIAVWRRRDFAGGTHLEREVIFERGSADLGRITVRHVEELSYDSARLVWREQGFGIGRTLYAEWTREDDCIRAAEWGLRLSWREIQSAARGAVMPLYLFELARAGRVTSGAFLVCDPVAQTLERLELSTTYSVEAGGERRATAFEAALQGGSDEARLRTVELVRGDGTLAARYAFRRDELIGFQWQEGDTWARRITDADYTARMEAITEPAPSTEH